MFSFATWITCSASRSSSAAIRSPSASVHAFQVSCTKNDRYLRMSAASTVSRSAASASRSSPVKSARSWRTRAFSAAVSARTVSAALSSTFLPECSRSCARAMRSSSSGTGSSSDRRWIARLWRTNADSRVASAERVVEQQPPPLVRDRRAQRRDERVQPRPGAIAGQRALRRHRKDRRLGHDRRQVLAREAQRLRQLGLVEQIRLGDHEDQPVARRAQDPLLEELPLRRGQDLRRVEQEHRRVGARQVAVGDVGALLVDVVDARRVDDRQLVREQRRRVRDLDVVNGAAGFFAPFPALPLPGLPSAVPAALASPSTVK